LRYNSSEAGSPAFITAYNDWLNQCYRTRWAPSSILWWSVLAAKAAAWR
jgi:hypothetical protein